MYSSSRLLNSPHIIKMQLMQTLLFLFSLLRSADAFPLLPRKTKTIYKTKTKSKVSKAIIIIIVVVIVVILAIALVAFLLLRKRNARQKAARAGESYTSQDYPVTQQQSDYSSNEQNNNFPSNQQQNSYPSQQVYPPQDGAPQAGYYPPAGPPPSQKYA